MAEKKQVKPRKPAGAIRLGFRAFSIGFFGLMGVSIGGLFMFFVAMFIIALTT